MKARTAADQRSIISTGTAAIVSNSECALPVHYSHVSLVLEKQAHSRLIAFIRRPKERSHVVPAFKGMTREHPLINAIIINNAAIVSNSRGVLHI